jgi:hypothetical protein
LAYSKNSKLFRYAPANEWEEKLEVAKGMADETEIKVEDGIMPGGNEETLEDKEKKLVNDVKAKPPGKNSLPLRLHLDPAILANYPKLFRKVIERVFQEEKAKLEMDKEVLKDDKESEIFRRRMSDMPINVKSE